MIEEKVLTSFRDKNVLVTGGTGLIGRQVVDILCKAGASVMIASLDRIKVNDSAEHIFGDLSDFNLCKNITRDMDFVFHLAGIKGSIDVTKKNPASFFVPLLMINTNMLEASRINKARKVVYTSSIGAYTSAEIFKENQSQDGPPMDMFPGWAKRMAELQVQAYKIQYGLDNFSIVRPCNCFSEDTYVLTPNGRKNIKDFLVGDKVYTLNIQSREVEIDTVTNIIKGKTNEIINFKGRSLDWEVTKDHKMFLSTNDNQPRFIKAEDLMGKPSQRYLVQHLPMKDGESPEYINLWRWVDNKHLVCVKTNVKYRNTDLNKMGFKQRSGNEKYYETRKSKIKDIEQFKKDHKCKVFIKDFVPSHYSPIEVPIKPFLKVLAWYITEGNIAILPSKSSMINIAQKQRKYRKEIIKAIKDSGFNPVVGKKSISFTSRLFKNMVASYGIVFSKRKSIPNFIFTLDLSLRELFFETLMKGDGHKEGNKYTTISKRLAEDVFHLAFTCGKQPLLREKIEKNKRIYRIYFRKKKVSKVIKPRNISLEKVDQKKVYCITAKNNHVIFAGRNGFFGWVGQCYGPGDNFDPDNAMVIPSLMSRIYNKENPVRIWGDGTAIRDFAYSRDVAEGVILALYHGTGSTFVNLGSGKGYSIKELVETLNSFIDFNYEFDASKPSGFSKRVMDISLARELIGYNPTTDLADGLKETWDWFTKNHDEYIKRKNYFEIS